MSATLTEVEDAIHRTIATVMAMSELLDATLMEPEKTEGHLRHYQLTNGQVDARLEIMSSALERATCLRELFYSYTRGQRERKAVKL
jgi:ABC-type Na+ transport system ATPase subunit NatA